VQVSAQHGLPRYESLQPNYNLYDRAEYEAELEPLCLKEHVGVISYFSLAKGFLTGKYRAEADLAQSVRGPGVKRIWTSAASASCGAGSSGGPISTTPGSVALAWLIARPSITAPIASATSLAQLNELIAATELELDQASIELLNQASAY